MKDTGGPAFPLDYIRLAQVSDDRFHDPIEVHEHYPGMTLRDYFAAEAMQAMIGMIGINTTSFEVERIPQSAYCYADDMIKERNK